jgi:hypothetical protein
MKRSEIFWGLILIGIGALLLLDRFLNISLWRVVGPLVLIAIGMWVVVGSRRGTTEMTAEECTIPLENTDDPVTLRLKYGLGEMILNGGASEGLLAEGTFVGGLEVERRAGPHGPVVTLHTPQQRFGEAIWPHSCGLGSGFAWNLRLTERVPLMLEMETGLSHAALNLETLDVPSLTLKGGLGAIDLVLPGQVAHCQVRLESGLGAANVTVPQGVAVRIQVESGLAGTSVDERRFPKVGGVYLSPEWEQAAYRVEMHVQHGLGSVTVR